MIFLNKTICHATAIVIVAVATLYLAQVYANISPMQLQVSPGSLSCSYSGFDLGSTGTSFSSITLNQGSNSVRECIDLRGTSSSPLQVIIGTLISNGTTVIAGNNTRLRVRPGTSYNNCLNTVFFQTNFTAIASTTDLMKKQVASDICSYGGNIEIQVQLPGQATVGNYSGIITITFPGP